MKNIVIVLAIAIPVMLILSGQAYSSIIDDNDNNRIGEKHSPLMPASYTNSTKARADSIIKRLDSKLSEETAAPAEEVEELPLAGTQKKVAETTSVQKPKNIQTEIVPAKIEPLENPEPVTKETPGPGTNSSRLSNKTSDNDKPVQEAANGMAHSNPDTTTAVKEKIMQDVLNLTEPKIDVISTPDNGDNTANQKPVSEAREAGGAIDAAEAIVNQPEAADDNDDKALETVSAHVINLL